jgi:hypothetical protein
VDASFGRPDLSTQYDGSQGRNAVADRAAPQDRLGRV